MPDRIPHLPGNASGHSPARYAVVAFESCNLAGITRWLMHSGTSEIVGLEHDSAESPGLCVTQLQVEGLLRWSLCSASVLHAPLQSCFK